MCRKGKILLAGAAILLLAIGVSSGVSAVTPDPVEPPIAATPDTVGEYRSTIEAMKPPKRSRPVVAVLGDNRGTEAIDFLVPYGVLKQSGAADVFAISMQPGTLQLRPALAIEAHMTASELDERYPDGADYVIVPAMFDHKTADVIAWIREQAAKGATIVAICSGAEILANAGLLEGREATTHWASVNTILKTDPTIRWQPHRRYVADRGVVTTTGVSAAMPVSIALVEAIAGRDRAGEIAERLGVSEWGRAHDSGAYSLGGGFWTGVVNMLSEPGEQELGIAVRDGVDDIALALTADTWSRTYRSKALTIAPDRTVRTQNGLELVVDRDTSAGIDQMLPSIQGIAYNRILEDVLADIAALYGRKTARLVAVQLEYDSKL